MTVTKRLRDRLFDPPDGLGHPFPHHLKSIREIDLSSVGGFIGRYRKFPRAWIAETPDTVYVRRIYCWLFADEQHVGSFELIDFDQPDLAFVDDDEFCFLMDAISDSAMVLAELLVQHWPDVATTLFPFGRIILIDRAWVKPGVTGRSQWAAVLRRLIEIECRRYSLLVLKAFPLEHENKGKHPLIDFRRRALMRLYRREFGMKPFPGKAGDDGWMYAISERLKGHLKAAI
jgi:hypothetical protein